MIKKGSTLYFANNSYSFMMANIDVASEHKDEFIIQVQQCVEKFLKALLERDLQKENTTHNITTIAKELNKKHSELRKYRNIIRELKDCYYERRYNNANYLEFEEEEFEELLRESLRLIEWLRVEANKGTNEKTGLFK